MNDASIQQYLFQLAFKSQRTVITNSVALFLFDFIELASFLFIYCHRATHNIINTPLFSYLENILHSVYLQNFDSEFLTYAYYALLLTVFALCITLIYCALRKADPPEYVLGLVSMGVFLTPLISSLLFARWSLVMFVDSNIIEKVALWTGILPTAILSIRSHFIYGKQRRLPEFLMFFLCQTTTISWQLSLAVFTVANIVLFWKQEGFVPRFKSYYSVCLFIYCILVYNGFTDWILDSLSIYILAQPLLVLCLQTEDPDETELQDGMMLLDHANKCMQPGCKCRTIPERADTVWRAKWDDSQFLRQKVLMFRKWQLENQSSSFEQMITLAEYLMNELNYSVEGISIMSRIVPTNVFDEYKVYRIKRKYSLYAESCLRVKSKINPQDIEESYQLYSKFRDKLINTINKLSEFYVKIRDGTSFTNRIFEDTAILVYQIQTDYDSLKQSQMAMEKVQFLYHVFNEIILNQRSKVLVEPEVRIQPFIVIRDKIVVRCNREFEELVSLQRDIFLNHLVNDLIPSPFLKMHDKWYDQYLEESRFDGDSSLKTEKLIRCQDGLIKNIKLMPNIMPVFQNGLEIICFADPVNEEDAKSPLMLVDFEKDRIQGCSQELFSLFRIPYSRNEYHRMLKEVKPSLFMPSLMNTRSSVKINFSALQQIFKIPKILKENENKVDLVVKDTSLQYLKCIQFNYPDGELLVNSTKDLKFPKDSNYAHPELELSSIRQPYEIILIPIVFRIVFYVFFSLGLASRALDTESQRYFYQYLTDIGLFIIQQKTGLAEPVLAIPSLVKSQINWITEDYQSQLFSDLVTYVHVSASLQLSYYEYEKLPVRMTEIADIVGNASSYEYPTDYSILFYLLLTGVIVLNVVIYLLLLRSNVQTRLLSTLVCEAFILLDYKDIKKIIEKTHHLNDFFVSYIKTNNIEQEDLDEEKDQLEMTAQQLVSPALQESRVSLNEKSVIRRKSLADGAVDLVARLMLIAKSSTSMPSVGDHIDKKLNLNFVHLQRFAFILLVCFFALLGFHLTWATLLVNTLHTLGGINNYYGNSSLLASSLKGDVLSCLAGGVCQLGFFQSWHTLQENRKQYQSELPSYMKRVTEVSNNNICSFLSPLQGYPNITKERCLNDDLLGNGQLQTTLVLDNILSLQAGMNDTQERQAVERILKIVGYLCAAESYLNEGLQRNIQQLNRKADNFELLFEGLNVLLIIGLLVLTRLITRGLSKRENAMLALIKTIDRDMFSTNSSLKSKFKKYLPS